MTSTVAHVAHVAHVALLGPGEEANGRCVRCEQPTRRYGDGGNPLCAACCALVTVGQKAGA